MLKECLNAFKKMIEDESIGEKIILDTYKPADGSYILVDTSKEHFEIRDILEIKYNKKTGEITNSTNVNFETIKTYDYNSVLLEMNKPIDSTKIIHSNNYLTFFVKKENLEEKGKLKDNNIDKCYNILLNPNLKYKDKKSQTIYKKVEEEIGEVDKDRVEKFKSWIKENIFTIECEASSKEYVKIFFEAPIEEYVREGKRYLIPNIYNKNDYNQKVNEKIYGLPNDNMGMNAKKPYLDNKSRKTTLPYLLDSEDILLQKKFFDFLLNKASIGEYNTYINTNLIEIDSNKIITTLKNGKLLEHDFTGIYLRTTKGKNEAEIHDFDIITSYKHEFKKELVYANYLNIDLSKLKETDTPLYSKYKTRTQIQNIIDEVLFNKYLKTNYFTSASDIKINDNILKMNLLLGRRALFNWFYKCHENNIFSIIDKISLNLVKGSIVNNYLFKAANQFNLRWSLIKFFKGDENMADFLSDIQNNLKNKINSKEIEKIDNDEEYFFAIGQEVNYLLSLNKSSKKTQSLSNPFINAKNDLIIKEKLRSLYKKYNYVIEYKSKRADKLYSMILGYEIEGKVNQDMIIAGFLSNSLVYEKKEEVVASE